MSSHNNVFSHKLNVRIDDINFGNHLCHSKFINIVHNTRALFLKSQSLSESNCFGYGLVMLNLNIKYISQCFFDDLLEINLSINDIEKASISLAYNVFNHTSRKVAADASTLMGFIDIKTGKLKRVPSEFLNIFQNSSS